MGVHVSPRMNCLPEAQVLSVLRTDHLDFPCAESGCVWVSGEVGWAGLEEAQDFAVRFGVAANTSPQQPFIPRHTSGVRRPGFFLSDILILTSPKESCHIFK